MDMDTNLGMQEGLVHLDQENLEVKKKHREEKKRERGGIDWEHSYDWWSRTSPLRRFSSPCFAFVWFANDEDRRDCFFASGDRHRV